MACGSCRWQNLFRETFRPGPYQHVISELFKIIGPTNLRAPTQETKILNKGTHNVTNHILLLKALIGVFWLLNVSCDNFIYRIHINIFGKNPVFNIFGYIFVLLYSLWPKVYGLQYLIILSYIYTYLYAHGQKCAHLYNDLN